MMGDVVALNTASRKKKKKEKKPKVKRKKDYCYCVLMVPSRNRREFEPYYVESAVGITIGKTEYVSGYFTADAAHKAGEQELQVWEELHPKSTATYKVYEIARKPYHTKVYIRGLRVD